MDGLITASSTRRTAKPEPQLTPALSAAPSQRNEDLIVKSADDALRILQSEPSRDALFECLQWLTESSKVEGGSDIRIPSPMAAQLINSLVNDIIPVYWNKLSKEDDLRDPGLQKALLYCLKSVAGIGAVSMRFRNLIASQSQDATEKGESMVKGGNSSLLGEYLQLLEGILEGDNFVERLWNNMKRSVESQLKRTMLWKELISWLATGKILSISAEAAAVYRNASTTVDDFWVSDGKAYTSWLGRNIVSMGYNDTLDEEGNKAKTQLFSKALFLGFTDQLVETVFSSSLNGKHAGLGEDKAMLQRLTLFEQNTIISTILRILSNKASQSSGNSSIVGAIVVLLAELGRGEQTVCNILIDWLVKSATGAAGVSHVVHRAVIIMLSTKQESLKQVLDKLLSQFGDKLYIQHAPIMNQEVSTQDLLLVIGRLYRADASYIVSMARSSVYINAISNRISASSTRTQFLGMAVGMAVSGLVAPPDQRLKFESDELESENGRWYASLVHIDDKVGSLEDLTLLKGDSGATKKPTSKPQATKRKVGKPVAQSKIIEIEEIDDGSENGSDSDEIPVFAKPDSDPEDEDEDPTLIERNKPTAPVYIRDLIIGLRDSENFDRQRLALSTAATLIRRKASFGTEVQDHLDELASIVVGLQDSFNMEDFQQMRLQAMIAIVVAKPVQMGQWFSNTLFNGDYSMGQRASILTALSMAARELAGYREEDAALTGAHTDPKALFPSKKLPEKYDKIYRIDAAPVDALAKQLEQTMIRPMALEAADKMTGPNALKVRTFSSRMEVEKKRKRPITNELAKIVADGFFFPLTGRWRNHMQTHGDRSPFATSFLQTHFLKTLSLILNASGASTLSLPALTTEFWAFLLSFRTRALDASPVLEALLFAFLTLLEINENDQRRIAEDHSKELLETKAWTEQVFENAAGGSEEGEGIRTLAAGVLVRAREVVEKHQRLLMGSLLDFA